MANVRVYDIEVWKCLDLVRTEIGERWFMVLDMLNVRYGGVLKKNNIYRELN